MSVCLELDVSVCVCGGQAVDVFLEKLEEF